MEKGRGLLHCGGRRGGLTKKVDGRRFSSPPLPPRLSPSGPHFLPLSQAQASLSNMQYYIHCMAKYGRVGMVDFTSCLDRKEKGTCDQFEIHSLQPFYLFLRFFLFIPVSSSSISAFLSFLSLPLPGRGKSALEIRSWPRIFSLSLFLSLLGS